MLNFSTKTSFVTDAFLDPEDLWAHDGSCQHSEKHPSSCCIHGNMGHYSHDYSGYWLWDCLGWFAEFFAAVADNNSILEAFPGDVDRPKMYITVKLAPGCGVVVGICCIRPA